MLRIKQERLRRGWNQTALAFYAGVSVADISRIESGRFRPYDGQLLRISAALEVDPATLLEQVEGVQESAIGGVA
jgi:transcriptional regulator with XRE-family HTH domain